MIRQPSHANHGSERSIWHWPSFRANQHHIKPLQHKLVPAGHASKQISWTRVIDPRRAKPYPKPKGLLAHDNERVKHGEGITHIKASLAKELNEQQNKQAKQHHNSQNSQQNRGRTTDRMNSEWPKNFTRSVLTLDLTPVKFQIKIRTRTCKTEPIISKQNAESETGIRIKLI